MKHKKNFWEDRIFVPKSVSYTTEHERKSARKHSMRWNDELVERKQMEMETFNGKRDINEGETASTLSQSRVSANKAEKGQQIAQ